MKHIIVITTVGTSMFTNYKGSEHYKTSWDRIKDQPFKNWDDFEEDIEEVQTTIEAWNGFSCAELQTLKKLQERHETVSTYLVTSDTITSYLAGKILEKALAQKNITVQELKKIEEFDVLSKDKFKIRRGFDNYVKYLIETYVEGYNISGGYKAIIPITTLIASLKKASLFYNFEDSEMLIEVPPFPYDWQIERFEKFEEFFKKIQEEGFINIESSEYKSFLESIPLPEDRKLLQTLTIIEDDLICESQIGKIYKKAYEENKKLELIETKLEPEVKDFKLADTHHGNNKLEKFWKKIRKSKYIISCVNSIAWDSYARSLIGKKDNNGQIEVFLYWEDEGFGMKIQTTGRNLRETEKIAEILENEYDK
ncbi:hypothetical protein [Hugenholtzia roseola]|uniref:hypothetical protein n=1 Tax=Hugenholtzia roseola TaxID=1002 RepID=UPI00041B8F1D|nr:hypothetical protein [Hugenholtzia roseola]